MEGSTVFQEEHSKTSSCTSAESTTASPESLPRKAQTVWLWIASYVKVWLQDDKKAYKIQKRREANYPKTWSSIYFEISPYFYFTLNLHDIAVHGSGVALVGLPFQLFEHSWEHSFRGLDCKRNKSEQFSNWQDTKTIRNLT